MGPRRVNPNSMPGMRGSKLLAHRGSGSINNPENNRRINVIQKESKKKTKLTHMLSIFYSIQGVGFAAVEDSL